MAQSVRGTGESVGAACSGEPPRRGSYPGRNCKGRNAESYFDVYQKEPCAEQRRWVYFIQCGEDGPLAIGSTWDVSRKLIDWQVSHWRPLSLVALLKERGTVSAWI